MANENEQYWETITIEKHHKGDRIKFMTFKVKASEKSDLTKMVMDLLIKITGTQGLKNEYERSKNPPLLVSDILSIYPKKPNSEPKDKRTVATQSESGNKS